MINKKLYNNPNSGHISKKWKTYINTVKKVNPLLLKAFELFEKANISFQTAFDIGCGPGNESSFLVEKGIQVTAFDYNPDCIYKINERFSKLQNNSKFTFINTTIGSIHWSPVDLVVCIKVFPFLEEDIFSSTIEKIKTNLNSKGIAVLNFFGEKDEWKDLTLITKQEVATLFKDFEILYFEENISTGMSVAKESKQIHLIELIARKN